MKESFDEIREYGSDGESLVYGCIRGNEKIVFIKAGLGGDHIGYENKYMRIACSLYEKYGCTVISVSNPNEKQWGVEDDAAILNAVIQSYALKSPELYLFGASNGCTKGLTLANKIVFRRMVLVNMPLTINFHRTKKLLFGIPETEVIAVYGEKDMTYPYAPLLEGKRSGLSVVRIQGADHQFIGMTDEFVALAEMLFSKT